MGMRFGMVAVKAEIAQLMEAFPVAWPLLEPKARAEVVGLDALCVWADANTRSVSAARWSPANPETQAFGFWQDGEWAILFDPHFVRAPDANGLATLSSRFGTALSFVIETTSGTAFFWKFDDGRLSRHIGSVSGKVSTEGQRLAQESGLSSGRFFLDEMEALQRAFGITPLAEVPDDKSTRGASFVDRTDYSDVLN